MRNTLPAFDTGWCRESGRRRHTHKSPNTGIERTCEPGIEFTVAGAPLKLDVFGVPVRKCNCKHKM